MGDKPWPFFPALITNHRAIFDQQLCFHFSFASFVVMELTPSARVSRPVRRVGFKFGYSKHNIQ